MILKETILSAFSDRLTLLRWLKKVEAALNNAVLDDISIEQISETQVKLKFTFENGDFVESPVLTLPKGKDGINGTDGKNGTAATIKIGRVISAEPNIPPDVINTGTDTNAVLNFIIPKGRDGLDGQGIAATVEVGTVTTGAAGTNASVTNVGTEQRAILNFVIPRGNEGVGFDDAAALSINDGAINITAGDNGVNIDASFEVAVGDEVLEIPSTMYLPLKGSESIVIDVDESGQFIDIHLDADIVAKLSRVLVTPMAAPQSISLVAVDTAKAQTMLTLGSGLSVENDVLSASGGGSSTIYRHILTISRPDDTFGSISNEFYIFNTRSTPYTSLPPIGTIGYVGEFVLNPGEDTKIYRAIGAVTTAVNMIIYGSASDTQTGTDMKCYHIYNAQVTNDQVSEF